MTGGAGGKPVRYAVLAARNCTLVEVFGLWMRCKLIRQHRSAGLFPEPPVVQLSVRTARQDPLPAGRSPFPGP